jgi:hypothetical protein
MKSQIISKLCSAAIIATAFMSVVTANAHDMSSTIRPVTMTVTAVVPSDKRKPEINQQDIVVTQGKERLNVAGWTPAQGDHAGLELFILIDDGADSSLGLHLDELKAFINAQPSTTSVGVGYIRNATVQIAQNLTTDHTAAANALRLPMGQQGANGSAYLSVIDLMKRWPESQNRHEVLMLTDGTDRIRRGPIVRRFHIQPDVDSASDVALKTGTIIHTIYTPAVGRSRHNYWEATNGQMGMAKLSNATGGESFFLGLQSAVSFKPYLDQLQTLLDNQYLLTVSVKAGKKAELKNVAINTEVAGVKLAAADAVLVPAAK